MMPTTPEVTIGVIVRHENEVLLLKSHKWNDKYIIPCGHIEYGEYAQDAAKREVKEETGLDITDVEFIKVYELVKSPEFHDPNRHFVCLQFQGRTTSKSVVLNDEAEEYVWVTPTKAMNMDLDPVTRNSLQSLEYLIT